MSENLINTEEIIQLVRSLERKAEGLYQDKQDGEDVSLERGDIKEEFEEVNEEYKTALMGLHGASKESFKEEYGNKLTRIKQLIGKL